MNHHKFILLILNLLSLWTVEAQQIETDLPEFLPPSPTAFAMSKEGSMEVGFFSGTAQAQIPIYSISSSEVRVPIGLNYSSNGIKVDQMPTTVGLGWSLTAGGVITRSPIGTADDRHSGGFVPEGPLHDFQDPRNNNLFNEAMTLGNSDLARDIYSFSFPGFSGKFSIAHDGRVLQMPQQGLRILPIDGDIANGFVITTPDGAKFNFTETELTRQSFQSSPTSHVEEITAWYLSEIKPYAGHPISFTYTQVTDDLPYTASRNDVLSVPEQTSSPCPDSSFNWPNAELNSDPIIIHHTVQVLTSIVAPQGKLDFYYSGLSDSNAERLLDEIKIYNKDSALIDNVTFNYHLTGSERTFLTKVQFLDQDRNYVLDYERMSEMPPRLSRAQDWLGYYNGQNNLHLIPYVGSFSMQMPSNYDESSDYANRKFYPQYSVIGLLNKITYPTKGYTQFEYEANSEIGSTSSYVANVVELNLNAQSSTYLSQTFTSGITSINYPGTLELEILSYNNQCSNSPHLDQVNVTFEDNENPVVRYLKASGNPYNPNYGFQKSLQVNLYSNTSYTLSMNGNIPSACYSAKARLTYYTASTVSGVQVPIGGIRVKKIIDHDPVSGQSHTKRVYYNHKNALTGSSAIRNMDNFVKPYKTMIPFNCDGGIGWQLAVLNNYSGNSFFHVWDTQNEVVYKYITVSHGGDNFENGGEQYEYLYEPDHYGVVYRGNDGPSMPLVPSGVFKGTEKEVEYFKKVGGGFQPVKKIRSFYTVDASSTDFIHGYLVQKKYTYDDSYDYVCTSTDASETKSRYVCTNADSNHDHFYWKQSYSGITKCIAVNNNNQLVSYGNPCSGATGQTKIAHDFSNLDIYGYTFYSKWYYKNKREEVIFSDDGGDSLKITTNFYFENPEHQRLTRKEVTASTGDLITTSYSYPDDVQNSYSLGNANPISSQYLITYKKLGRGDLHRINEAIQVKQNQNSNSTVTRKVLHDFGVVLPEKILTFKNAMGIEERLQFLNYDTNGNPLEVKKKNGTHIVYFWGYQDQLPIAKIENATSSQVANALNTTVANLENFSEGNMTAINGLRNILPNAMITTYTYKPLTGMTSTIDPRGYETTYHYDPLNRLHLIKDADGKIISENKYNYKN